MTLRDKLNKLSTPPSSDWIEETAKQLAEQGARRHARKVALVVLEALDKEGLTQQALADRMGVSRQQVTKIVKGKENLTFETVAKLENALKIEILSIKGLEPVNERPAIEELQMISVSFQQPKYYGGGPLPAIKGTMLCSEAKTQQMLEVSRIHPDDSHEKQGKKNVLFSLKASVLNQAVKSLSGDAKDFHIDPKLTVSFGEYTRSDPEYDYSKS